MKLSHFVGWFKDHPRQSNSSIRDALNLMHKSQVDNFLSQIEFASEHGKCPITGRANVPLYSFVAMPHVKKPAINTIRERRRHENRSQTAANSDRQKQLIYQPTIEACVFPAMCYSCKRTVKHKFERGRVIGTVKKTYAEVTATCKKCGKQTTK